MGFQPLVCWVQTKGLALASYEKVRGWTHALDVDVVPLSKNITVQARGRERVMGRRTWGWSWRKRDPAAGSEHPSPCAWHRGWLKTMNSFNQGAGENILMGGRFSRGVPAQSRESGSRGVWTQAGSRNNPFLQEGPKTPWETNPSRWKWFVSEMSAWSINNTGGHPLLAFGKLKVCPTPRLWTHFFYQHCHRYKMKD